MRVFEMISRRVLAAPSELGGVAGDQAAAELMSRAAVNSFMVIFIVS